MFMSVLQKQLFICLLTSKCCNKILGLPDAKQFGSDTISSLIDGDVIIAKWVEWRRRWFFFVLIM
jgi:hypothetical protein